MIGIDISAFFHAYAPISWDNTLDDVDEYKESTKFFDRYAIRFRSMMLNTLLDIKASHADDGEEINIMVDGRNNWRKKEFQYYKYKRKFSKTEDYRDWDDVIYPVYNEFIQDLRENFFFKISNTGCEADDSMYVLYKYRSGIERIISISDDIDGFTYHDKIKDFKQINHKGKDKTYIHACKSLKIDERYITPEEFRSIKYLIGDSKDGVPNWINEDDIYTKDKRATGFGYANAVKLINGNPKTVEKYGTYEDAKKSKNYLRNKKLLDFREIPQGVQDKILSEYLDYAYTGSIDKIRQYISDKCNTGYLHNDVHKFLIKGIVGEKVMGKRVSKFSRKRS